jgi:N4-gp56 family major capsid protein
MSNATPSRLGQINSAGDANALFLKVFSGEVLSAFERENLMLNMTTVRNITNGKSAQFPVTGTIASSYHTVGNEILGSSVNKNEKIINIDDMLLASAFIGEIDELKNHYDVRSIYSREMGQALAKVLDKNLLNLVVIGARTTTANVTGGNAGTKIVDADADSNATSLKDSIFDAIQNLDEKDVPSSDRYIVVKPDQYYQLLNLDSLLSRDFSADAGDRSKGSITSIGGVPLVKSNTAVQSFTDQSGASTSGQNNTYIGNFANVQAVIFHKSAVGTVKLKDLVLESTYDPRRIGTLMTARMACGSNFLRPESSAVIQLTA